MEEAACDLITWSGATLHELSPAEDRRQRPPGRPLGNPTRIEAPARAPGFSSDYSVCAQQDRWRDEAERLGSLQG
jgi:hypothetical protein